MTRQRETRGRLAARIWVLAALLSILPAGCGDGLGGPRAPEAGQASRTACQRIVTLAPNLAEMVFALGLGERLVGVGDYSHWPPATEALPKLGGLLNPNLERLISLEPDLAVLLPSENDVARQLRRVDIDTLTVPSESLEDIEAAARAIGSQCGIPAVGERVAGELAASLAPTKIGRGRSVLITIGRTPGRPAELLAAGPGTFLDQILRRLGAVNAMGDAPALYPQASLEEVLGRKPDVIIELRAVEPQPEERRQLLEDWRAFPQIPAVSENRVRIIAGDWTLIPGPRLPMLYAAIAETLEP